MLRPRSKNSREKGVGADSSVVHAVGATEETFRALVKGSNEPMALVDEAAQVRYSNSAAASLLGYAAPALQGRNILEGVHPKDSERAGAFFKDILNRPGVPVLADFRFRHQRGGYRSLGMVGVNRLDAPGVESVILTLQDITDREQAAETRACQT